MISKNLTRPLALLIFEGALVYLCGVMAIYIRFGWDADVLDAERGWLKTLLVTVLVLASFYLFDLYDFHRIRRRAAAAAALAGAGDRVPGARAGVLRLAADTAGPGVFCSACC